MRTVEEYLSIKLDLLWQDARTLEESIRLRLFPIMGDLMTERGEWKKLSELHEEPITNPDYAVKNQIRHLELNGCYFGNSLSYRGEKEPFGTNFKQPIIVTRKEYNGFYSKLFPYRLIQVTKDDREWDHKNRIGAHERLSDFLEFHLKEHFDNDFKSYKSFLVALQAGDGNLIRDFVSSINLWIDSEPKRIIKNLLTHREKAIIQSVLVERKLASSQTAKEQKEVSSKYYQANLTLIKNHKTFRNPTDSEIANVIAYLKKEYPKEDWNDLGAKLK